MKKILLTLFALGMLFLTGCVVIGYTEKADLSEFVSAKRFLVQRDFDHLKVGNKYILLEDCYIVRNLPTVEWRVLPWFFIGEKDRLYPVSYLKISETDEYAAFIQKGSGSWFYTPPVTFSANRIKEKIPQGSILEIIGFYLCGHYLDFENGDHKYILLKDEKSGKDFYLFALDINEKFNNRRWIEPYYGKMPQ